MLTFKSIAVTRITYYYVLILILKYYKIKIFLKYCYELQQNLQNKTCFAKIFNLNLKNYYIGVKIIYHSSTFSYHISHFLHDIPLFLLSIGYSIVVSPFVFLFTSSKSLVRLSQVLIAFLSVLL